MTRGQMAALQPGQVIRHRRTLTLRVVVENSPKVIALRKIRSSWTDPNPRAVYLHAEIADLYLATSTRARLTRDEVNWMARRGPLSPAPTSPPPAPRTPARSRAGRDSAPTAAPS